MHIVDAHLHYMTRGEHAAGYDPDVLIRSDVISRAWILSANAYARGHATYGRNMLPIHMDAIAKEFPKLVIIVAHAGGDIAYFEQTALICRGHSRFRGRAPMYIDLSSELTYYSVAALEKIKQVIDDIGAENVIYGSDTYYRNAAEVARFWRFLLSKCFRLHAESVERIMGVNAEEIVAAAQAG